MMVIPSPLSPPAAMPLHPQQKLAANYRAAADNDGATSFSQILERREVGVLELPNVTGTSPRLGNATDDLVTPPTASGAGSAVAFINGSLFGHSTSLSGSSATAGTASSGAVLPSTSSARFATTSEAPQAEPNLAQNQPGQQPAQRGQAAQSLGTATQVATRAPVQIKGTTGTVSASDFSAIAGSMIGDEQADPGLPEITAEDATPISSEPAEALTPNGTKRDGAGTADEMPATNASVSKSGFRDAQVASLSPVHVALAIAADGPALRIVARVSGATTIVEDQVENSLLTVARQSGAAVDRLRLNGVERLCSVGGEA